jgi:hypothetical protein
MRKAILLLHLSACMAGYREAFTFIKIRRQKYAVTVPTSRTRVP